MIPQASRFNTLGKENARLGKNMDGDVADWWGSCELMLDSCGMLWKTPPNLHLKNDSTENHRNSQATNLPTSAIKQPNTSVRSVIFSHME
jgi:hypothetical protein